MKCLLVLLPLFTRVAGECVNGCNGNGDCGANDACVCYSGFSGGDCSLITCPSGVGFVDAGAGGDFNHDTIIGSTTNAVNWAQAYVQTQLDSFKLPEYWPTLQGYTSGAGQPYYKADGSGLDGTLVQGGGWAASGDEGHFLAPCSNKGICDTTSGQCNCFAGYTGSACQRAECPASCNGHGSCLSVGEIAATAANKRLSDSTNGVNTYDGVSAPFVYRLWDSSSNYGCVCDAGYTGIDCSQRTCPGGDDPLTSGQVNEVQGFIIGGNQAGGLAGKPVNYRIVFYDYDGFSYTTGDWAIDTYLNYGSPSNAVAVAAAQASLAAVLEALPNNVTGQVSVTITGNGLASTDNNIRVMVSFVTLSGNVPDMNVIPGGVTTSGGPGTPAVAQPFNRVQTFTIAANAIATWYFQATIYPQNLTSIRRDPTLLTDDTTSVSASQIGASSAAGVVAAILASIRAIPAISYYGVNSVNAVVSGTGPYTVTVVLPNADFGANPLKLTLLDAGLVDRTALYVTGPVSLSTDGTTEYIPCAGRGLCDYTAGLCSCFTGYYGTACDTQSALAA